MLDQSKGARSVCGNVNGACCIDTYRIYDSCRNQECLEDLRVFVTDEGQRILDIASAIRIKSVKVLWAKIDTDEMPFNKGYFQISIRYFFHCVMDCCTGLGTGQDVAGLCVFDKSVMLYGGEGNVSIFKSDVLSNTFCPTSPPLVHQSTNLPRAVVEAANPVALRLNVMDTSCADNFGLCVIKADQIPENICQCFDGRFTPAPQGNKTCFISLGLFSLVRMERPAQLVIPACDSCIPGEESTCELPYSDPCALFRSMEFPVKEFYPEMKEGCGES